MLGLSLKTSAVKYVVNREQTRLKLFSSLTNHKLFVNQNFIQEYLAWGKEHDPHAW